MRDYALLKLNRVLSAVLEEAEYDFSGNISIVCINGRVLQFDAYMIKALKNLIKKVEDLA